MRARIIGLIAVAALATPAALGQVTTAAAETAQVYVTGYVDRGYTATGTYVHPGTCAVDPRVIPLGSYITISGLGTCHAEDTGSAVIGYRVDVWVPTVAEAYAITGWRTATWGGAPAQQVLGYHAAQSPTPTPTPAPTLAPIATASPVPSPESTAPPSQPRAVHVVSPHQARHRHVAAAPTPIATAQATTPGPAAPAIPVATTPGPSTPVATTPGPVSAVPTTTPGAVPPATTTAPHRQPVYAPAWPPSKRCRTMTWTVYVDGHLYHRWLTLCG